MYIGVLGSNGMLGRAVVDACTKQNVECVQFRHYGGEGVYVDICDPSLERNLRNVDALINCAGCIQRDRQFYMVQVNALGPHNIARSFDGPIVHVSTDCVFSGRLDDPYHTYHTPDPLDLYGRSKACGEVESDHVLNVRTSFIGFDHGLLHWATHNEGQVEGWVNAVWSGSTVWAVADQLVRCAVNFKGGGIAHLATLQPINKSQLLGFLSHILHLPLAIKDVQFPVIDRSLEPTIVLPGINEVAEDLIERYKKLDKVVGWAR